MSEIELQWEPRPQQVDVTEVFEKVVNNNTKFFFADMAVGTGKSYAIMMMARKFQEMLDDDDIKFDVVTNTKLLQDQYLRDFNQMRSVKGVDNYYCSQHRCNCSEGMELNRAKGVKCLPCNYKTARKQYLDSDIGVLNFHLFISYWEYSTDMMESRGAKILFIDEAHGFEETYGNFINAFISKKYLAELDIWNPEWEEIMVKMRTVKHFATFIRDYIQVEISAKIEEMENMVKSEGFSDLEKVKILKEYKHLKRTNCKYERLLNDEKNWSTNWVIQINKETANWEWTVEAVWASQYLEELWAQYDHVVFLSGTILDKKFFTKLMGCDPNNSEYLLINSPFPVANRMIVYLGIDKLSYKRKRKAFENMIPEIENILERHKNEKGIIHTTNYEIARWIEKDVEDEEGRMLTHTSYTKKAVLDKHHSTEKPTVLVSPSMINGVDLKDELSRFQIIVKVPYPNLSSLKVKERMKTNKKWYSWKTLCDIMQSYGRSTRSETDWSVTYILDENFENLIDRIELPEYIGDAILWKSE